MKEEDEKRKKEERIKAEASIIAKIGTKPTDDKDYIENMMASELANGIRISRSCENYKD